MLFYSNEARESAIKRIEELCVKIGEISGDQLSYTDATEVGRYLQMLSDEIRKEAKSANGVTK